MVVIVGAEFNAVRYPRFLFGRIRNSTEIRRAAQGVSHSRDAKLKPDISGSSDSPLKAPVF
jgi:hypothetical protein